MSQEFRVGQRVVSLVARPEPGQPGLYQVVIDGAVRSVHVQHASDGSLLISREDGSRFTAHVSRDADERRARWVTVDGATQRFMEAEVGASDDGQVRAAAKWK